MLFTSFERHLKKRKGAIHIGGNVGEERFWYEKNGFNPVLWFEPYHKSFIELKKNICDINGQTAYNIGISDETKKAVLNISSNGGASSSLLDLKLHKKYHPKITYIDKQEIDLIRFDLFVEQNDIDMDNFNMLNIDVQGTELNVLKSFGNYLNKIDYILTEVNEDEVYDKCCLIDDLDSYLSKFNFKRLETHMTPYKWGDAFYSKI